MAKEGLIDRWVHQLSTDSKTQEETRKMLINRFKRNYKAITLLAKKLEAEAKHLPYKHLEEEAQKLIKEKLKQAETIKKLVARLGGEIDMKEIESHYAESNGQYSEILKLESELGSRFGEDLNLAEDGGLEDAAKLLIKLKNEHTQHLEQIERLVMKINAAL